MHPGRLLRALRTGPRFAVSASLATLLTLPAMALAATPISGSQATLAAKPALRAAAVSGAIISVSPTSVDFGTVIIGHSATRYVTVTNSGDATLTLESYTADDPHFSVLYESYIRIAPGGFRILTLTYVPTVTQTDIGTLTILSDAANSPSVSIPIRGAGVVGSGSLLGEGIDILSPTGERGGDQFGVSVASAGDFNGDGIADVIVGAWANDTGGLDAGRAYLYYGGANPSVQPSLILQGAVPNGNFGTSVASAGDVNGDGFDDVIVGAWRADVGGTYTGKAYVYLGGPSAHAVPDRTYSGLGGGERFGVAVASAGDVNGDGYDDVIVGAYLNQAAGPEAGRAYVFFGGPVASSVPNWILTGEAAYDWFGWSVAGAGDVNGDGYDDVLVGAPQNDAAGGDAGRAYLYFGGPTPDAVPDLVLTGEAGGNRFGVHVASAGDVNGDGHPDLIIGADMAGSVGDNPGRAYVFLGGPAPSASPALRISGDWNGGGFGESVAAAGDTDGDGYDDFLVGAWLHGAVGAAGGRVYLYRGGPTLYPFPSQVYTAEATGDRLGNSVSGAGDVNGDGHPDIILGAYFNDDAGTDAGRAYVISPTAVAPTNHPPVLTTPGSIYAAEGVAIAFAVHATDPDGDHVTLGAENRPVGSIFVDEGDDSGSFSWTPGYGQAGSYTVTFTAHDPFGAAAEPSLVSIVVDNVNRAPTASAGGPYAGVVGVGIGFDATGSSDPDGDALTYAWQYGDGSSGTGPLPSHAYATGGVFLVTLTVSDGLLTGTAQASATVQDVFPAVAFTEGGDATTRLNSGKATTCVQIEPSDRSYLNTSVDLASVVMISTGTGSVDRISAQVGKVTIGADRNRNGVEEITACFSKPDLRLLFGSLSGGKHTVAVTLEGDLTTGGRFRATLEMVVIASNNALAAAATPNPLNPTGTLTFRTTRQGAVTVSLFDLAGRRVRTVVRAVPMEAGYHDVTLDARRDDGVPLASGIYFFRVDAAEGTATGRIAVVK